MGRLSEAEVSSVYRSLGELCRMDSCTQFHDRAPELLAKHISAETIVLNLLGPGAEVLVNTVHGSPMPSWIPQVWPRVAPEHPVAKHMRQTQDATPRTLSDFWSPRRLHQSNLYAEILKPLGVEDQLSLYVDPVCQGVLGITFNRASRSFGDRDRRIAELLTAGLTAAYAATRARQQSQSKPEELGLPPRQAEVLGYLARGATYVQIGSSMGISLATVRTHVERLYTRLGVCSRGEAVSVLLAESESQAWKR